MATLETLPVDCLAVVAGHLPLPDVARLLRVSKKMQKTIDADKMWHRLAQQVSPGVQPLPIDEASLSEAKAEEQEHEREKEQEKEKDPQAGATTAASEQQRRAAETARKHTSVTSVWKHTYRTLVSAPTLLSNAPHKHSGAILAFAEWEGTLLSGALDRKVIQWDMRPTLRGAHAHAHTSAGQAAAEAASADAGAHGAHPRTPDSPSAPYTLRCVRVWERASATGVVCMLVWREMVWVGTSGGEVLGFKSIEATDPDVTLQHQSNGWVLSLGVYDGCLVSGGDKGSIKIWDADAPSPFQSLLARLSPRSPVQEQVELTGHTKGVLALTQWDTWLCSGSSDTSIRVWDESHACIRVLSKHTKWVQSLVVWQDHLFSAAEDKLIHKWNRAGDCVATFEGHQGPVRAMCVWGTHLYTGSHDTTIRVWTFTGNCVEVLRAHTASLWALFPWRNVLISGGDDGVVRVWGKKSLVL